MMLEWFFAFFFNLTNALEMKGELGVDVLKDAANGNEALGQIVNLHNYYNAWTVMIKIFELKCSFKMFFVFVQIFDFFYQTGSLVQANILSMLAIANLAAAPPDSVST